MERGKIELFIVFVLHPLAEVLPLVESKRRLALFLTENQASPSFLVEPDSLFRFAVRAQRSRKPERHDKREERERLCCYTDCFFALNCSAHHG